MAAPSSPEELASTVLTEFSAVSPELPGAFTEINDGFAMISAYLVFFMHCGFAMLSIGCVRSRFAKHIAILILLDACASAIGFYLFGFAFAFGDPVDENNKFNGNPFIGKIWFALSGTAPTTYWYWFFEWTFAATACTIVSGAIAERTRFEAYAIYSFFMAAFVYPVVVHSIWSGSGWASMFKQPPHAGDYLFGSGAIDFAGSGAVHMVGGVAAFTGAFVVGPRIGRFLPNGTVVEMSGHNVSLFVLGVMILWFGWYGFNPGSQLAIVTTTGSPFSVASSVANAAVTTTLSPAAAGLSGLLTKAVLMKMETGTLTWDIMTMGNSVLAGLVAITSGCSVILPWGAIVVGVIAGWIYVGASRLIVKLKIDDPLDAIAVHCFNGTMGVIAVGFLAGQKQILAAYGPNTFTGGIREYGCFLGGSGRLLAAQLVYALWITGWVACMMMPLWYVLKFAGLLRVSAEHEAQGLDVSHHGGTAYPGEIEDGSHKGDVMNGDGKTDVSDMRAELAALRRRMDGMHSAANPKTGKKEHTAVVDHQI